ncbi:LysR substrate-binding domain-containing protein [Pigmentiphaga sp. CHJ604]|uniref:LysR substrate-binding domain-containing protein n=1 Tax=Pigmentiphaga sp. CHJ604 TaxID=3081984 RepID=UPI0030CAAB4B
MTLQQLRYFVATVESGFNISRAAQVVHTSQPGISKQIKLLEQQLGATLLNRSAGRIVGLTEAGNRVFETAKRVLRETDSLAHMGQDFLREESGRLVIATLHTYAQALLPHAAARLRDRYPRVSIELQQSSPGRIIELVRGGDVDIGITMEVPGPRSGVVALPLMTVPRLLLVPVHHPLLQHERVTLAEIVRYPFVVQTTLSAGGWAVNQVLKARGFAIEAAVTATDASLMKAYVEQGLGIAIMSAPIYNPERDLGIRGIDISHIFDPSEVTLLLDPYRYQRGYVLQFIHLLAPRWAPAAVAGEIRRFMIENEPVDLTAASHASAAPGR